MPATMKRTKYSALFFVAGMRLARRCVRCGGRTRSSPGRPPRTDRPSARSPDPAWAARSGSHGRTPRRTDRNTPPRCRARLRAGPTLPWPPAWRRPRRPPALRLHHWQNQRADDVLQRVHARRDGRMQGGQAGVEQRPETLEQSAVQILLGLEVIDDQGQAHAGLRRDVAHGHAVESSCANNCCAASRIRSRLLTAAGALVRAVAAFLGTGFAGMHLSSGMAWNFKEVMVALVFPRGSMD